MKRFFLLLSFFLSTICFAQRVPITANTYDNFTDIDNYFGEIDSLLQHYNIQSVKIFYIADTTVLYRMDDYKDGKKVKVQEFNDKSGKPERIIQYKYGTNVLDAYITHYPSAENYNIFPSRRFYYLIRENGNLRSMPYKWDDTVSYIVCMHIRHTWREDGTILFEGFDRDGKLVDTHVMTPLTSWENYQKSRIKIFPRTINSEPEEYVYNEKGQLVLYKNKDFNRERIYSYDERGLVTKLELIENRKLFFTQLYKYE